MPAPVSYPGVYVQEIDGPIQPAFITDAGLLPAYQRTTGEPGDPAADALLEEIERRGLGV